jgi:hypothetical protein
MAFNHLPVFLRLQPTTEDREVVRTHTDWNETALPGMNGLARPTILTSTERKEIPRFTGSLLYEGKSMELTEEKRKGFMCSLFYHLQPIRS